MCPVSGTYRNGRIELDYRVEWPEGAKVRVCLRDPPVEEETLGLSEETWVETPENRAALIASIEALDPPELTPEEWAEWEAARKAVKEYTIKKMWELPLPPDDHAR